MTSLDDATDQCMQTQSGNRPGYGQPDAGSAGSQTQRFFEVGDTTVSHFDMTRVRRRNFSDAFNLLGNDLDDAAHPASPLR